MVAASIMSGCASTSGSDTISYSDLKAQGAELYQSSNSKNYKASTVKQVETIRLVVNTAFLAAQPVYEEYIAQIQSEPAVNNYFAAVEALDSEVEKKAVYDKLTAEQKKTIDDFNNSAMTKKIMSALGEAALTAMSSAEQFKAVDTTSLLSGVSFSNMLDEKDKLGLTLDQILYLNDTVISAYDNYKIISAFRNAQ